MFWPVWCNKSMLTDSETRPIAVTALSALFLFGTVASFISSVSLFFPGSFLEPLWIANPRAHEGLSGMGVSAIILMGLVSTVCALAAIGLCRGARWGYWLAIALLTLNLLGDVLNVVLATEPRAAIGVPIVIAIFVLLRTKRVRRFFRSSATKNEGYPRQH